MKPKEHAKRTSYNTASTLTGLCIGQGRLARGSSGGSMKRGAAGGRGCKRCKGVGWRRVRLQKAVL